MAKPIGPICNLDCTYCYYLEKEKLFPKGGNFKMRPEVLETFIRQYIDSQNTTEATFAWQGGEPTLLGVDYFQRIIELQRKHSGGRKINNTLQTNGILLDDEWCLFFKEHDFLIGLSIDGPRRLHDIYRVDKGQKPTFDRVMAGMRLLKKHKVEFNTLTVVSASNVKHPLEVYNFLREMGSGFIQFIPLVERLPTEASAAPGTGATSLACYKMERSIRGLRGLPHLHIRGVDQARRRKSLCPNVRCFPRYLVGPRPGTLPFSRGLRGRLGLGAQR